MVTEEETNPTPEEEKESEEVLQQKVEFHAALEKGHHKKAGEILTKLPEATENLDLMQHLLRGYQLGMKASPIGKKKKKKEPSDEAIIEAYLNLESLLAEKEVIEKQKKRPYTFYFVHFRQVANLRRRFEKTRRK